MTVDTTVAVSQGMPSAVENPETPEYGPRRGGVLRAVGASSTAWISAVLAALVVLFSLLRPGSFASVGNIRNIATDAATLLVLGIGMTYVIITAGIDLSVGSVLIFSGVVAAKVMGALGSSTAGWEIIAAGLVTSVIAGAAWGLVNGFLVTKARVPALIVTLGTFGMSLGLAQVLTDGVDVRGVPVKLTTTIGNGDLFGTIPWLVVVAAAVTVIGGTALAFTRFGRYTFAIGSNPEAARRVGINVDRHLLKVYGVSGLLAGLAGFLSLARFSTTTIGGHTTDNLGAIAAVVLGGTSLFGGVGTVIGTVVGVFIPAVLQNGFIILGVPAYWQGVAVGAVLILAVYVDQLRRRGRARG